MKFKIAAALLAVLAVSQPWTAGAAGQPTPAAPVAAPAPAAAHPLTRDDVADWADGLIPYALKASDIAGAVVVVVKDGQVLFEKGYGYADVKTQKPVDPQATLFRPGSITKLFTWTAVMQLKEAGKVDLDADINRYLDFKIPPRDGKPITLRNLMTHTPGFEDKLKYIIAKGPTPSFDYYIKNWIPKREFAPGTVPSYSNYGAALAGYIVQRVSGQPYADYVQQHILDPLQMAHSTVRQPMPPAFAAAVSTGYRRASQPPGYLEFVTPAPAGDLAATGDDMGKFMIAHLQNGAYGNARILKPETAVEMHTAQPKFYPALNGQALGFYENDLNGQHVIAHDGGTQFFLSDLHLFLNDNVGIFISLNSDGIPGSAFGIHEAFFHGFADRYFPSTTPAPPSIDKATALADARLMAAHPWETTRRSYTAFTDLSVLLSSPTFKANSDGTLSGPGGASSPHLREVARFVWRNDKTGDLMQAATKNGVPVMVGFGQAPPSSLVPVPAWRSPTWLLPALEIALGVLLLSGLLWPVRAVVRRKYRAKFALAGKEALAYRGARAFALAAVLAFAAFPLLVTWLTGDIARASDASNALILLIEGFALISFVGVAVFSVWDGWMAWTRGRGWGSRVWTTLTAVSALLVLWVGWVFHLIVFNTNF